MKTEAIANLEASGAKINSCVSCIELGKGKIDEELGAFFKCSIILPGEGVPAPTRLPILTSRLKSVVYCLWYKMKPIVCDNPQGLQRLRVVAPQ